MDKNERNAVLDRIFTDGVPANELRSACDTLSRPSMNANTAPATGRETRIYYVLEVVGPRSAGAELVATLIPTETTEDPSKARRWVTLHDACRAGCQVDGGRRFEVRRVTATTEYVLHDVAPI